MDRNRNSSNVPYEKTALDFRCNLEHSWCPDLSVEGKHLESEISKFEITDSNKIKIAN